MQNNVNHLQSLWVLPWPREMIIIVNRVWRGVEGEEEIG
jgi:hypothetical protein